MSGGSGAQPHSQFDVPPGFRPLPKPTSPVPSNVRRTTAARGSTSPSVGSESRAKATKQPTSEDWVSMDDSLVGDSPGKEYKRMITRKRARPQILDPSPQPARKRRGRPPGSGRRQRLASWLVHEELEIGKDTQASLAPFTASRKQANVYIPPSVSAVGNQSSPLLRTQSGEHNIQMDNSPPACKCMEQGPKMKKEPHDVGVEGQKTAVQTCSACIEDVHKPATGSRLREDPFITIVPRYEHEIEGIHSPNNPPSQITDAFLHHVASTSDDTGESHPAANVLTVQVGSYDVNSTLASTLQAIMNKYGDIAKDCPLESGFMRNSIVEGICKVVQELQRRKLNKIDNNVMFAYYSAVKDALKMKLNVKWLHQRLDEIFEALKSLERTKKLTDEKIERMEIIENLKKNLQVDKVQLEKLKSEIEVQEGALAMETQQTEKLTTSIRNLASKFLPFQNNSLVDGLL